MKEIEVPGEFDLEQIEAVLAKSGLTITLQGTLRQYPGCTHWHLKRGREKGTLELTWWPQKERLWFKVATNRGADWMDEAINNLTELTSKKD